MSDPRDSNHDGKVSLMEKIKHKLHKGSKDKDAAEYTTFHTSTAPVTQPCNCATCLEAVGFPPAQAGAYTNGGYDPRHPHGHQFQAASSHLQGQQLQNAPGQFVSYPAGTHTNSGYPGGVIPAAIAAVPLTGAAPLTGAIPVTGATYPGSNYNTGYPNATHVSGSYDSRDVNRDGHISAGEKLAGMTNSHPSGADYNSGAYDSRDLNRDGRLSASEKLRAETIGSHNGAKTSRDINGDGRVSIGEKLAGASSHSTYSHSGAQDSHDLNRNGHISTGGAPGHTFGGYDSRDSNHDGRVSVGEKLVATVSYPHSGQRAHDHHKDLSHAGNYSHSAGVYDVRDINRDGRVSVGEEIAAAHNGGAYDSSRQGIGAYDARDTNHDGRVSIGEKLAATGAHSQGVGGYDSRDINRDGRVSVGEKLAATAGHPHNTGAYDILDSNRDGHVSIGEKLAGATGSHQSIGAYDSRDVNHDGHISMGEKLASSHAHSGIGAYDSRDLNRDGHVSMGENLAHHIGSRETDETRLRLHEEQLAVSKRQVSAGVVGLTKRVQEERVQHRVPVKREELIVERRPLTGVIGEHAAGTPSPDEISRVTIYREDIVTHTRLVPTEEIIVRKKIVTEQQTVAATLRSERMETTQSAPTHLPAVAGGAYDARDTNLDGHVSTGERLHAATRSSAAAGGVPAARDINHDGHVSAGERLHAATGAAHQIGTSEEMRLRLHEEQLAVSKREVQAGEVSIHKLIQEERVEQLVPVRREELVVERRSLAGVVDHKAGVTGPDEVSRVTLYREEIVIEKRLVPIEEVIVRKRVVTDYQTVDAILRSEHFETTQLSGGYDARDTNHDGHVSVGEKLKGAAIGTPSTGAYDARDTNHDGHVSMGEKLKGAPSTGVYDARDTNLDGHVSMGEKLKGATGTSSTGAYDARDTNHDGHVSAGEKLKGAAIGTPSTGVYDARDTNHDGHVSVGEKLKGATGNHVGYDARDTNRDGHVSASEALASEAQRKAARG